MNQQTIQEQIRKLIAENKTESAFELLSHVQFTHVDKELIILNSQYNRIQVR